MPLLRTFFSVLFVAFFLFGSSATRASHDLGLVNNTGHDINQVYARIGSEEDAEWSSNILSGSILRDGTQAAIDVSSICLLYTSDAADD